MDELFKELPIFTVLLFGIVALRISFQCNRFNVPITNYFNFANLLSNSFDILHGLLVYIFFPLIFIVWKSYFLGWINRCPYCCVIIITSIFLIVAFGIYKFVDLTYRLNMLVKLLLEIGLFGIGIICRYRLDVENVEALKITLLIVFLFWYLKFNMKYEIYHIEHDTRVIKITMKGGEEFAMKGFLTNTVEFAFFKKEGESEFHIIPMSEIVSIVYS